MTSIPRRPRKPQTHKPPYNHSLTPPGMRYCPRCEQTKDIALFMMPSGMHCYCKPCRNAHQRNRYSVEAGIRRNLLRLYGLTREEYERLIQAQGGVCACCGEPETVINGKTGKVQRLSVDHHHASGQVRKLLCNACNNIVGYMENDVSRVEKCLAYLKKHS